jgi:hypothetical protein
MLGTTSCVLGPDPVIAHHVADGAYCVGVRTASPGRPHRPPEEPGAGARTAVARGFSARALDTARAIGALAQVESLAEAEARSAPDSEIVDLRGQLNDAIALATLDLASAIAHIQCEEGRAGQVASDLRDAEQQQARRLTVYSIGVTAAASIASGMLAITDKDPTPSASVGIAGGVGAASFGLGALAVHRTTTYLHAHNILGQLWYGGAHPDFPEIVWAFLTRPQFTQTGEPIRDYLVQSWKESGRLGDDPQHPSAARVALYFGNGGLYDADGLDDRADMLSEVRESIDLMNHDLQDLATEAAQR